MLLLPSVFLLSIWTQVSSGSRTTEEWKSRIIYQLLTDRFSQAGEAPSVQCSDLKSYCGGTFVGIKERLDYIQSLGASAIWISPFVENTDKGYHGYWAKNIFKVNPMFGTREELLDLVDACHERDIWVMMDVVANHMGYPVGTPYNFTDFVPFNETWHYHEWCEIEDFTCQESVELCRLFGLPDLNETQPFVRETLLNWIANITQEFGFDGYRIDTVVEMPKSFWRDFYESGDTFMMGEANNGDRTCYTGAYQGPLPSLLNFPQYWAMRRAFTERKPMTEITDSLAEQRECFSDVTALGLFVDNHDFPRFLNLMNDTKLLSNALAYVMFGEGFPLVYYGTEQSFHGGGDPLNRESLWPYYSTEAPLYKYIKSLTTARKSLDVNFTARNQVELFVDSNTLVFARGKNSELLVVLTNVGHLGAQSVMENTVTGLGRYTDNTEFVNIFTSEDIITVNRGATVIRLNEGLPKVYLKRQPGGSSSSSVRDVIPPSLLGLACMLSFFATRL
ncbi:hypothetical protein BaRGS_00026732 [Batillaria attramentaria]|uniref:alpha-amylase n=1 Tax=Batillaria attramentaria TaxID=370345 RepID=A0ABD0K547_9CAEN